MRKLITTILRWSAVCCFLNIGFPLLDAQSIGGNVFQDFNYDGVDNDNGLGLPGIRIYLFDAAGNVDSTDTDSQGDFEFTGLTNGTAYRLEFHPTGFQKGLESGFFGLESGTTVQFITAPNTGVSQGFALPTDFCQTTPTLTTPCYVNGSATGGGSAGTAAALIGIPESASGGTQADNINMALTSTIGACWGVSYQRETKLLFTSAVLRRHSGFGPGGPGAIYVFDVTNPNAPVQQSTIDLVALGVPVGSDPRVGEPLPADILIPNHDSTAFPLIGKMSLGDMDISEDGKYLYVVNLFNRRLYKIFINNPFETPTAADVESFQIPNPGCGTDSDWRPWGLKIYKGEVYVGIVCTAESTNNFNNLHAYVRKLNSGGGFDPVLVFPLTFTRGNIIFNQSMNTWNPWTNDWNTIISTGNGSFDGNYPTPILSDIEFDIDGSMILGFLDRTAMQGGYLNYGPSVFFNVPTTTFSGGDILRACADGAGGYILEGTAGGCTTTTGSGNMQGPNGSEYYWEETFENSQANPGMPFLVHQETALGGLALIAGKGEIITTAFDPLDYNTGGVLWLDNADGSANQAYEIFPPLFGYAGKSAGLGDVEALCAPAPIEKGNFVWKDKDQDGIQDPGEEPIEGVNVSLYQVVNGNCNELKTVQTNADGEYYFNSIDPDIANDFLPNTEYFIVVGGMGQFNTTSLQLFDSLFLTVANTGTWSQPDWNDSDGELAGGPACFLNLPHVAVTTGSGGQVDHKCDFGFFAQPCDIMFVSAIAYNETCFGANDGEIEVEATATVGVVEYSLNGGAFSSQNSWTNLAPGSYTVVAQIVGDPACSAEESFIIFQGPLPQPPATTPFEICRKENVPQSQGLTATCDPCPNGDPAVITWWTASIGGTLAGSGSPFDPVSAGFVDKNVAGQTTFYAQCECGTCFSNRAPAVFTVLPLPQPDIVGEPFPCPNSTHTYTTAFVAGNSWTWTLSGGGQIVSQNQNSITIKWTGTQGATFTLSVKETDAKGCMETDQISVCIRSTVMVCDDVVQVSLGDNCKITLNADLLLEGNTKPVDDYQIIITPMPGMPGSSMGNMILAKGTYNFKVIEPCVGNSCWGKIIAEDKQPPILMCSTLEIPCSNLDTAAVIPNLAGMPLEVIIGGLNGVKINDNCGIVKIFYSDGYESFDCSNQYSGKITRHWTAIDMSGNAGSCEQMIFILKGKIADVVFPNDATVDCTSPFTDPVNTGSPTLGGYSLYPASPFCKINTTFKDDTLRVCDGTRKIFRKWTVYDWCLPTNTPGTVGFDPSKPANPRIDLQIIKIEDANAPFFTCPTAVKAKIDPFTCTGYLDLPDVIVTDACSHIHSAEAKYPFNQVLAGDIVDFAGNNHWLPDTMARFGLIENLPAGSHTIKYVITDDCHNHATCEFEVEVEDDAAPSAVCVEFTKVSLGFDGTISVNAANFDKGSNDNCGQVFFKARRMDGDPCNGSNSDFFNDKVKFCCEDIGDTVQVIVRVYDAAPDPGFVTPNYLTGHFNDCMVRVRVEDKLKPVCFAPADVTVDCSAFDPSGWAYGNPNIIDNCMLDTFTVDFNFNDFDTTCNRGTLRRIFTATDVFGNSNRCTQRITVNYNTNYKVRFPDDKLVQTCDASTGFGEPIFTGKDCETPAVSYHDQIFNLVPDACFKILRTWEIADWCNYDANQQAIFVQNPTNTDVGQMVQADNQNRGRFKYVQIIKVLDNVKPVISNCPTAPVVVNDLTANDPKLWNKNDYWDPKHSTHDLCESPANLSITATDACSGANLIITYSIQLDLNFDGKFDLTLLTGQAGSPLLLESVNGLERTATIHPNFEIPHGRHQISWIVRDGCGNEAQCKYTFEIRDGKAPTVVCHNGLAANIMPTKMIQIWATDFVKYLDDNCTPAAQLELSIRKEGAGTGFPLDAQGNPIDGVTFTCNELGTQLVEVWARDKAGNAAFCSTYILVQDNDNSCSNITASVAGALETEAVDAVSDADVKISGSKPGLPTLKFLTKTDGKYNFSNLPLGDNYEIQPIRNDNWLNGVTTYDLLLISRHITGVKPFDSPFKTIAADANRSGSVTTNDIVQIRKMILGINDSVAGNTSWRFVPRNHPFSDPQNPWAGAGFPEKLTVQDLKASMAGGDFVGIKTGDVNGNATANNLMASEDRTERAGTLHFEIQEKLFRAGDEFEVKFSSDELAQVLGYQFALSFDPANLELLEVVPGNLPDLSLDNFGTAHLADGLLTSSFHTTYIGIGRKDVFTLRFKAKRANRLSKVLQLTNRITPTEAYSRQGNLLDISLIFNSKKGATTAGVGFELYQNSPNPFGEKTVIGFYLPENAKVVLTISDAQGREVLRRKDKFEKGLNQFEIEKTELSGAGVFIYKLETPFGTLTKKMILKG